MASRAFAMLLWLSPFLVVFLLTGGPVNAQILPKVLCFPNAPPVVGENVKGCETEIKDALLVTTYCQKVCEDGEVRDRCKLICKKGMGKIRYCDKCGGCIENEGVRADFDAILNKCIHHNVPGGVVYSNSKNITVRLATDYTPE